MQDAIKKLEEALDILTKENSSLRIATARTGLRMILDGLREEQTIRAKEAQPKAPIELTHVKAAEHKP